MTITFYNTTSSRETLNKTLTNAQDINIDLKDPTNVLHPTLLLGNINITGWNYCYIAEFKRYYYIADMDTYYNGMTTRELTVDPLMSHQSEILNLTALIERQENFYNLYLPDLQIPNYAYRRVQTKLFPMQPLNVNPTIILATTGMGGS